MISVKRAAGTLRTSDIKDKVKSCCHCESAFPVAETSSDNVTTAASTFLLCLSVTKLQVLSSCLLSLCVVRQSCGSFCIIL